jgi:MSHA biogenesis protein MshI
MVNASGLELAVIDIPELAMHAISSLYLVDSVGQAFLDLRRTGSTLNISLDGNLYLTRRINTQLDPDVMKSENWPDLRDRLVLELQRSLDYYESQIGKGQITSLRLAPRQFDGDAMSKELNERLQAKVEYFNLASYLQMNDDYVMSVVALTDQNIVGVKKQESSISAEMQQQCLLAIGATLRGLKRGAAAEAAGDTAA